MEQGKAFKHCIEPSHNLLYFEWLTLTFVLQTDISSCTHGSIQVNHQSIAHTFRTLNSAEIKASSTYESECLTMNVSFEVDKFRQYLEHQEFLLETDN